MHEEERRALAKDPHARAHASKVAAVDDDRAGFGFEVAMGQAGRRRNRVPAQLLEGLEAQYFLFFFRISSSFFCSSGSSLPPVLPYLPP